MTAALVFSALWALGLLAAYLWLVRKESIARLEKHSIRFGGMLVFLVASVARLAPNAALPVGASFDVASYQIVGSLLLQGQDVYTAPEAQQRHPYLPLQMYWMALAQRASQVTGLSFVGLVRLAPVAADVAIAVLLYAWFSRRRMAGAALLAGLAYALNPLPVFVSAYHGQFDSIPALCILLSLFFLDRSPAGAGFWLGLGILNKSWPALALPSLLQGAPGWRRKALLLGVAGIVPLAGLALYLALFDASLLDVIRRAVSYNHGVGAWGYTYFIVTLAFTFPALLSLGTFLVNLGRPATLVLLGLAWWRSARRQTPQASLLTVLVVFLAVTHAFSIQYLMWVVPFAVLEQDHRWLRRFTLGAFAYMFLAYFTLILQWPVLSVLPWPQAHLYIIAPVGLPAWFVTLGWAYQRVFKMGLPAEKDVLPHPVDGLASGAHS